MDKMFIVISFLIFFVFPPVLFSQEVEQQEIDLIQKQSKKFFISHIKTDVNNIFLNGVNYIETKVSPFFKIENFYFALDFPLRIAANNGGILNSWDYIYPSNYLNFVQTLGYQLPDQSFSLKVGSIHNLSLGSGLLISHFRNDLFLPTIRQLGLSVKGSWRYASFQFFTSNIESFGLGGGEISITPLKSLENSLFQDLKIYTDFIYDRDSLHILMSSENKINLKPNPSSKARYTYSVGITTPVYQSQNKKLLLSSSLEYAGLLSYSQNAILAQFSVDYNQFYHLDIGLAYLQNGFHINFFSPLYFQPEIRKTRPTSLDNKKSLGYQISNQFSFFKNNLNFYLDIYGQIDPLFSYILSIELKPYILGQLSLSISYIAEDMSSLGQILSWDSQKVNNFVATQIAYRFGDNTQLAFLYRRGIQTTVNNADIKPSSEIGVKVSLFF